MEFSCITGCVTDVSGLSSQLTQVISDTAALQTQLYAVSTMVSGMTAIGVYMATFHTAIGMLLAFYLIESLRRG